MLELRKHFAVQRHLVATDRAPIRRIEGKHDRLPTKLAAASRFDRACYQD